MNTAKSIAILAIILPCYLLSAEPSAFGAGDLNNPNPYGLTSTEAVLLETKKNLNKVVVKSNNQANEVESLRQRVDGLQSIIESISTSSHENRVKIKSLVDENMAKNQNGVEYEKRVSKVIEDNANSIAVNTKEIEKINQLIIEISKIVDSINESYVTKSEFNSLVNDVNKFKDLVAKELKAKEKQTPKQSTYEGMSNGEIETKAKDLYDKKSYSESIKYYKYLIDKNYKPARSHYMVGEAEYYKKNYAEAIAYFKKSASLYSKADYMPLLMLHTAISMDETGDKKNAATFYDALISQFPNSDSAKTAKSRLSKIQQ
ncbi:tetratricopeptide repeat protein [Sulfurimonas crateris]|uniref:Tetratricopeptide repeat protein n=1 Tax=Sulfurimonas crateris TaxID=2574727 RepID=A0A4U2Z752_9BACT|nr:tetratricopeptide repeat protein [Sulfurimonas crateris]TKI69705.1 tetratricopeptide repeat protein [Sulfurimonas crateris]